MKYENIKSAKFLVRLNRFVCEIEIDGKKELCHIKNTGRLSELLLYDATVYVTVCQNPHRKTKYDLICVEKDGEIINVDSTAPNYAVGEYLKKLYPDGKIIPEKKYGSSRFDFYVETGNDKIYIEVKGVTLFRVGRALFPDAPTERGIKHLCELCDCVKNGYTAKVFFVIAADSGGKLIFSPNRALGDEFASALTEAKRCGVEVCAFDCKVGENCIRINNRISVEL